jgi:hypothetical protein
MRAAPRQIQRRRASAVQAKLAGALALCLAGASPAQAQTPILRSMPGDKGSYFLLSQDRTGDVVRTLHKRVGVSEVGFTRAEVNCRTRLMRELGYGEGAPEAIKTAPTKWFELIPGSSKSDLARFVCKWP